MVSRIRALETRYKRLPDWLYFFLVIPSLSVLPRTVGYRLARRQGQHLARANKTHYDAVCRSLRSVLPKVDADAVGRRVFENLAFEDLDTYYYPFWNKRNISRYVTFSGLEHLDSAIAKGKGVVLYTGHFGSVCAPLVAFALRGYRLFHLSRNSPDEAEFTSAYRKYARLKTNWMANAMGHPLLFIQAEGGKYQSTSSSSAMLEAFRMLRQGQVVSMAIDVPPDLVRNTSVVDFLGMRCRFPAGLVNLAYQSQAPILNYFVLRDRNKPFHQHITVGPPISLVGNVTKDLQNIVELFSRQLTAAPDQWFCWDSLDAFLVREVCSEVL